MTFDPNDGRGGFGARLFGLRYRDMRMSQQKFSDRFWISPGAIKDAEQGRGMSSRATRILIEMIALDPALVDQAVIRALELWELDSRSG